MNNSNSSYQQAILQVYQTVDQYLLEVLSKHSQDYQIMVFSDHGAGTLEQTVFLNHWLAKKGYLAFKNTPLVQLKRLLAKIGFNPESLTYLAGKLGLIRHAAKVGMAKRNRFLNRLLLSYADLNWHKTKAYSFGMYGGIYLTKKDHRLAKQIILELKQDFADKLTFIDLSTNIYQTKKLPQTLPDIQFLFKDGAIVSTNIYAFSGNKLFTNPITNKSGEHRVNGILGFYPKIKLTKDQASLLDITPTILGFYQSQIPDYCQGQALLSLDTSSPGLNISDIEI